MGGKDKSLLSLPDSVYPEMPWNFIFFEKEPRLEISIPF
jgi:hypothetical protein